MNKKLFNDAQEDLETGLEEFHKTGVRMSLVLQKLQENVLSHAEYLSGVFDQNKWTSIIDEIVTFENLAKHRSWTQSFNARYHNEHVKS